MSEHTLEIVRIRELADAVRCLTLAAPDGAALPPWTPGAHIDLVLDGDLVRQYSLCGSPDDRDRWTIAVLRESASRGGSDFVHDKLSVGDLIGARGPRNHFELVSSPRYLMIAGGIGITPLVPMLAAAERAGADWRLEYGGRTRSAMAFAGELSDRYGEKVRLHPQDEVGLLPLDELLGAADDDTAVYCCGPAPLLRAVEQRCADRPTGSLHVEHFTPAEVLRSPSDGTFEVELAESGVSLMVPPGQTILSVLTGAGVDVLSSCEEGTCGTCETVVIEGRVDHRDSLLTPEERAADEVMYICVSRAAEGCPKLVLER